MSKIRKGHNLERIDVRFSTADFENFQPKQVFNNKWIILKVLGRRGDAHCYEVCDKRAKNIGTLYVEIADDGMSSVVNHTEFLHKQFSVGNSHRFTTVLDTGFINNHVFFLVVLNRAGPLMSTLLNQKTFSPATVAFIAIDLITLTELLTSTGFVWRNFDAEQWIFDVKTRTFCLTDPTDITVISDKRYCPIKPLHFESAKKVNLHWRNEDLTYAPVSFLINGPDHRMSELDMMESLVYVLYELAYSKLPWKGVNNSQKIIEMKNEFMDLIPEVAEYLKTDEDLWLDTALRNVTEYLKLAHKMEEQLEKQPVRDGAWCPNGARAGALISTVKYREIIDDFHRVATRGKPAWSCHWKDVRLDWDQEFTHMPTSLAILEASEKREIAQEVELETARLEGARVHYSIMKEHAEAEHRLNAVAIEDYLNGVQEVEEPKKGMATRARKKRRTKKEMEEEKKIKEEEIEEPEESVKEPIVKKEEEEQESTSPPEQSARAARLQKRHLKKEEELPVESKKRKKKVIFVDDEVKIEDFDDYEQPNGMDFLK